MKRFIPLLVTVGLALFGGFLLWASGYDFDRRHPDIAVFVFLWTVLTIASGIVAHELVRHSHDNQ